MASGVIAGFFYRSSAFALFAALVFLVVSLFYLQLAFRQIKQNLIELDTIYHWANLSPEKQQDKLVELPAYIQTAISQYSELQRESLIPQIDFEEKIRQRALLDDETGLGNREYFDNRLEALLKEEDIQGAVYFIQFNEVELLKAPIELEQVRQLFESTVNEILNKIKGYEGAFIARKAGVELAVLVPEIYLKDAEKLADKLTNSIAKTSVLAQITHEALFHIGVSYFSQAQTSYQIKAEADMALRSAQLQGPTQWFMFEAGEVEFAIAKGSLKWRTFLNNALAKNLFVLFFQPVMAKGLTHVLHHEVLAKVRDNNGELISARVFLPMAVKCGLMKKIDFQIIEQICRLLNYDNSQHDDCSFNLSIESLLSEDFHHQLEQLLMKNTDITPRLIVEISEYQIAHHLTEIAQVLTLFNRFGVRVLVDKVGQFIESASYLSMFNIRYIKLDPSIVLNIDTRSENQIFIRSLAILCHQADVKMYALGVENEHEWQMLLKLGVVGGQGHYFTKPVAQVVKAIQLS